MSALERRRGGTVLTLTPSEARRKRVTWCGPEEPAIARVNLDPGFELPAADGFRWAVPFLASRPVRWRREPGVRAAFGVSRMRRSLEGWCLACSARVAFRGHLPRTLGGWSGDGEHGAGAEADVNDRGSGGAA